MSRQAKLEMIVPAASPAEAAAVVAAVEQFIRSTAPPPVSHEPDRNPWQQAALREGVMRAPGPPPAGV